MTTEARDAIAKALEGFVGSRRRSEEIGRARGVLFMDDYGHHPTEIARTLEGLKAFYPERRLVVDFMSHTYSRTRRLLSEFGRAFAAADLVVLHRIYPSAREIDTGEIRGEDLLEEVRKTPSPGGVLRGAGGFGPVPARQARARRPVRHHGCRGQLEGGPDSAAEDGGAQTMKSMTGFGYGEYRDETRQVTLSLKSYNNRFLDIVVYLPPPLAALEQRLRDYLSGKVLRGRVELSVKLTQSGPGKVLPDPETVRAHIAALRQLAAAAGIRERVRISHLLRLEGLFRSEATAWMPRRSGRLSSPRWRRSSRTSRGCAFARGSTPAGTSPACSR